MKISIIISILAGLMCSDAFAYSYAADPWGSARQRSFIIAMSEDGNGENGHEHHMMQDQQQKQETKVEVKVENKTTIGDVKAEGGNATATGGNATSNAEGGKGGDADANATIGDVKTGDVNVKGGDVNIKEINVPAPPLPFPVTVAPAAYIPENWINVNNLFRFLNGRICRNQIEELKDIKGTSWGAVFAQTGKEAGDDCINLLYEWPAAERSVGMGVDKQKEPSPGIVSLARALSNALEKKVESKDYVCRAKAIGYSDTGGFNFDAAALILGLFGQRYSGTGTAGMSYSDMVNNQNIVWDTECYAYPHITPAKKPAPTPAPAPAVQTAPTTTILLPAAPTPTAAPVPQEVKVKVEFGKFPVLPTPTPALTAPQPIQQIGSAEASAGFLKLAEKLVYAIIGFLGSLVALFASKEIRAWRGKGENKPGEPFRG